MCFRKSGLYLGGHRPLPSSHIVTHSVITAPSSWPLRAGAAQAHLLCGQHLCLPAPALCPEHLGHTWIWILPDLFGLCAPVGQRRLRDPCGSAAAGYLSDDRRPLIRRYRCPSPVAGICSNHPAMMMTISSIFLIIHGSPEAPQKDPALGISARGGRADLPQDEGPCGIREDRTYRLSGTQALVEALPAGPAASTSSTTDKENIPGLHMQSGDVFSRNKIQAQVSWRITSSGGSRYGDRRGLPASPRLTTWISLPRPLWYRPPA